MREHGASMACTLQSAWINCFALSYRALVIRSTLMPACVGVGALLRAGVERRDGGDLVGGEREVEDVDVLGKPLGVRRPGDRHNPEVNVPAEDNLRGRLAIRRGDRRQSLLVQQVVPLPQRAPGYCDDVVCA